MAKAAVTHSSQGVDRTAVGRDCYGVWRHRLSKRRLRRIVAFGNSLTAGLGVPPDQSYPAHLQRTLDAAGYAYRVVNAGVSGDTTAGGVRRVSWVLNSRPAIVIFSFGWPCVEVGVFTSHVR